MQQSDNPVTARATVADEEELGLSGEVLFSEHEQSIEIEARIGGMQADRTYALFLLEDSNCRSASPPEAYERIGTLRLTSDSEGHYDRVDGELELEGSPSIVGRAVALYAAPSTAEEAPGPASGDMLACGIIQKDSPPGSHRSNEQNADEPTQEEAPAGN